MRRNIIVTLLILFSLPTWADDSLYLSHELVGMEQGPAGTEVTFKLTLNNRGSHQYRGARLELEDVALSVLSDASVDLHTLPAGGNKGRFLDLTTALSPNEMSHPRIFLFHFKAEDESGRPVAHLLRSHEVEP